MIFFSDESQSSALVLGTGYNGVVKVNGGTGALLWDGRSVLTAAHVVSGIENTSVTFETAEGKAKLLASFVDIFTDHDAINYNGDLAIVHLVADAPNGSDRYEIYKQDDEVGRDFTAVGYGDTGIGSSTDRTDGLSRYAVTNTFDVDDAIYFTGLAAFSSIVPDDVLFADFDSGALKNNAFLRLIPSSNSNYGSSSEGIIAPGDSGGPAFIDGKIAGVASYVGSMSKPFINPDYDSVNANSSFGEIAAWQRVSQYVDWIQQTVRDNYENIYEHSLKVILKPGIFSNNPLVLDVEEAVAVDQSGLKVDHYLTYEGVNYDYQEVVGVFVATVSRDKQFTTHFQSQIASAYPDFADISYNEAINLVGNFSQAIIDVAGFDGDYLT